MLRKVRPTLTVQCQHRLDLHLHSCKAVAPEHGIHHLLPAQHMRFTALAMQLALPPAAPRCGAAPRALSTWLTSLKVSAACHTELHADCPGQQHSACQLMPC